MLIEGRSDDVTKSRIDERGWLACSERKGENVHLLKISLLVQIGGKM